MTLSRSALSLTATRCCGRRAYHSVRRWLSNPYHGGNPNLPGVDRPGSIPGQNRRICPVAPGVWPLLPPCAFGNGLRVVLRYSYKKGVTFRTSRSVIVGARCVLLCDNSHEIRYSLDSISYVAIPYHARSVRLITSSKAPPVTAARTYLPIKEGYALLP